MWNLSGVLSSAATKRRSEPSGLASLKYWKLPRLKRTSTGTSVSGPEISAPAGVRSKSISLRYDQSLFHQARACPAQALLSRARHNIAKTRMEFVKTLHPRIGQLLEGLNGAALVTNRS